MLSLTQLPSNIMEVSNEKLKFLLSGVAAKISSFLVRVQHRDGLTPVADGSGAVRQISSSVSTFRPTRCSPRGWPI
jgi:hypothetical protein